MQTDKLKEYITFSVLMAAVSLLARFVDGVLTVAIAVPLLIAVFTYRNGLLSGVVYVIIAATMALVYSSGVWLLTLTVYGIMGMVLGYLLSKPMPHEKSIFMTIIGSLCGLLMMFYALENIFQIGDIGALIAQAINAIHLPAELLDQLRQSQAVANAMDMATFESELKSLTIMIMPSLFALMVLINVVAVYALTIVALRATHHHVAPSLKWSRIQLPGNPISGTTIVILMALAIAYLYQQSSQVLIINTIYLVITIFAIQGIAVTTYIVSRTRLNVLLRAVMVVVLVVLLQLHGLGIAGWIDATFNIRGRISGGMAS